MKKDHSNNNIILIVVHSLVILLAAAFYWQHRNYEKSNTNRVMKKDLGGIIKDIAKDQWLNAKASVRILISILRIVSMQSNNKKHKGGQAWKQV